MIEALELERQGRGDENTREILYEERDVKDYDDSDEDGSIFKSFDDDRHLQDEEGNSDQHLWITGPKVWRSRFGFGFANIPVIKKILRKFLRKIQLEEKGGRRRKRD